MENEKEKEKLDKALLKVALGYSLAEVTEEFAQVDGELKLMKRKQTKKDIPPDIKAMQLLFSSHGGVGLENMTDEELEEEKNRLLSVLESVEKSKKEGGQVCVEQKKSVKKSTKKSKTKTKAKPSKKAVVKTSKES